ncbi:MAG: hypothetical protein V4739_07230 [Pseudomonadota bacterium]
MAMRTPHRWALRLLAAAALLAVFLAYLQPEFALTAANWVWNCF